MFVCISLETVVYTQPLLKLKVVQHVIFTYCAIILHVIIKIPSNTIGIYLPIRSNTKHNQKNPIHYNSQSFTIQQ